MLLPRDREDRYRLYRNLVRECSISRDDRKAKYQRYRGWYLYGTDNTVASRFNKIKEHIASSASYLYSPDSVRFNVVFPPHYADRWMAEADVATEEIQWMWMAHRARAALTAEIAVRWAHVYDSMVAKVLTDQNEPTFELIPDPSDIGLWREEVDDWAKQEAICHWYYLDIHAYRRYVEAFPGRAMQDALWAEATEHAAPRGDGVSNTLPNSVTRIILAQASPNMIGVARGQSGDLLMQPRSSADVVRMAELWVRDDEIDDYRVVTMFVPTERVLWDPANPLTPGEHPFRPLSLEPTPGFAWGIAPIVDLLALQVWREDMMNDIGDALGKQFDPPIVAEGVSGIMDEKLKALRRRGSTFTNPTPGGKVYPFQNQMPPDAFQALRELDTMFAQSGGLPLAARGAGDPGVRSGDQELARAMLSAAGPTLMRAMLVETWLGEIATSMLRLKRRVCPDVFTAEGAGPEAEGEFLLAQMPGDFACRVSAHSASPIYQQQLLAKTAFAASNQWIDAVDGIELLQLPARERLKAKAKRRALSQAEIARKSVDLKESEARAKMMRSQASMLKAITDSQKV